MAITLKNCRLADGHKTDLTMDNGRIAGIGANLNIGTIIDIKNNLVIPGVIDAHVHFREPGGEHKEDWLTGSMSAVAGGVTAVIDMPNNTPAATNEQTLSIKRELAKKSIVNYGFYLGATADNLEDIKNLSNVVGVKIFMGSSTGNLLVDKDEDIERLFTLPNILWGIHAEDEQLIKERAKQFAHRHDPAVHSQIRSRATAVRAVERLIDLAKKTHSRVHICHVNTAEEVALIKKAKKAGLTITCEVSPHHLFLTEALYQKLGNFAKVNPPLRTIADNEALWQGLKDGTIDIIATDHAPHTHDEKWRDYDQAPAGLPEVQTSLPLLLNAVHQGKLTLEFLVQIMAARPAEIFRLKHKGRLAKGWDADITVIDQSLKKMVLKKDLKTKCGWSPYEGWELTGWPIMTFVSGQLAYDYGTINKEYKGKELIYGTI